VTEYSRKWLLEPFEIDGIKLYAFLLRLDFEDEHVDIKFRMQS